jgi:hypothetical protein
MSTQSTPSHRPRAGAADAAAADEDDDQILKRMEEILLTYKSKVETRLAAEGRQLPKEIFEDFTTQWVHDAIRETKRSPARAETPTSAVRTTPTWRKDHRDGHKETKIPMPTFFNSPMSNEAHI